MSEFDLRSLEPGQLVLHFGGRPNSVGAQTLAEALLALSAALQEIRAQISPDAEIELVVESLAEGSFRAKLKTILNDQKSVLIRSLAWSLITGVLGNVVYDMYIKQYINPDQPIQVQVSDDMVVIQKGRDRIIVPRPVYDATTKLKKPAAVKHHVARVFEAVSNDPAVTEFGLAADVRDAVPIGLIPRQAFETLSRPEMLPEDGPRRFRDEKVKLVVVRAIFEKSRRKWEFSLAGFKISAPILDDDFFIGLASGKYRFGQGDILVVDLRTHQKWDDVAKTYFNVAYEVMRVHEAIKAPAQAPLEGS